MLSTKSKILTLLEGNRDIALSGSDIAGKLGISRSAVWKGAEELRKEGHAIVATTNRGYILSESSDLLSPEGLCLNMKNPLITYDKIHLYKSVGSTNQEGKRLAVAGAGHGTLIMAEEQTEGRGRLGRSFFSPKGTGIYMSLILRPRDSAFQATLATAAAAVAVSRAISKTLKIEPGIKWVNDIFVGKQKVCGILTEALSDIQTRSIESLIIGIGVNVSTRQEHFPKEIQGLAGSLAKSYLSITRNFIAANILDELYDLIFNTDTDTLIEEYKNRSFILGKSITVYRGNEIYDAKAIDIDSGGGLIIRLPDGSFNTLRSGEVSIRPKQID